MEESDQRVSVSLTFDFDAISPWLQVTTASPSFISRGEFGPIGLRRILDLLRSRAVTATFYVPGHTALAYPEHVQAVVEDGHEVAHHGWVHEGLGSLSERDERTVIERGIDALESVTGSRPSGFRAPLFDLSSRTIDLLIEYGFSYDSSMMGDDFDPYWCRSGDLASKDEAFVFGTPVDLVEVPVAWHLNDMPFFEFVPGVPNLAGGSRPSEVLEIWEDEFTWLHERTGEGTMTLTMHPQTIGRGHRLLMLDRFIEFVLGHNATFVRAREVADRFRNARPH